MSGRTARQAADAPTAGDGIAAIERDLDETRERLAHTVDALVVKADEKAAAAKQQGRQLVVVAVTAVLVVIAWRKL